MVKETKEQRRERIITAPLLPLLIKTAIPTIIGMLVTVIYNLTDTSWIGKLDNKSMTAAIGIVFAFVSFVQAVGFWFGYGSGNVMSRKLGEKNESEAEIISSNGIVPATVTGIVLMIPMLIFVEPLAALLGLIGIPLEGLCYFGIYRMIAPYSQKLAHAYRSGIFGVLIFGGAGVHVPCCAAVYFYRKMNELSPDVTAETLKFAEYFLIPATIIFFVFFIILTAVQIRAFASGNTPLPKWCWVFSVVFGIVLAVVLKLPNTELSNALATGWISLGNLWMFGGLLVVSRKMK